MDGLLLVDKPKGWSSFDVVAKVRGVLKRSGVAKPKVGHTGTLDPLATGLLVLTLGAYCKRASEFSKLDKTYETTMWLGKTSTTGDDEGEKTDVSDIEPAHEDIEEALKAFVGEIMQTPPAYSAIKIGGQRAYKLARAGKTVEIEPRPVTIYSLELLDYTYPEVKFVASVSTGTYIRSLTEDIGYKLGTGAYMSDLRRTQVGDFPIDHALKVENLAVEAIQEALAID